MHPQEIAALALVVLGLTLAAHGYRYTARTPAAARINHGPALLRLIADLAIGVVQLIGFAAFVLGPRHAKVPDPLTREKARDIVAGRATNKPRPGGNKR